MLGVLETWGLSRVMLQQGLVVLGWHFGLGALLCWLRFMSQVLGRCRGLHVRSALMSDFFLLRCTMQYTVA